MTLSGYKLGKLAREGYLRWLCEMQEWQLVEHIGEPLALLLPVVVSCWRFKLVYEPGLTKAKGSSRFTKPLPFVNTEPHTCLPLPAHFEAQEKSKGHTGL